MKILLRAVFPVLVPVLLGLVLVHRASTIVPALAFDGQTMADKQHMMSDSANARVLASGRFHAVSLSGQGIATVHREKDGSQVLRLTEFRTDRGPDLWVYLVATPDSSDSRTVTKAGFVNLGRLQKTAGEQTYKLPDDLDVAKYQSVTIWSKVFAVNFATAPLLSELL